MVHIEAPRPSNSGTALTYSAILELSGNLKDGTAMARFAPGVFGFAIFVLWIWAVLDVIATDRILIRNLDKMAWLFLVIFVPTVGAVAWIALGRPANAGFSPGSTAIRQAPSQYKPAPRGPEDSDSWRATSKPSTPTDSVEQTDAAKERRLLEWEAELAKREANLEDPDADS